MSLLLLLHGQSTPSLGLPQETDSALAITRRKTLPVSLAVETDTALPVTVVRAVAVGPWGIPVGVASLGLPSEVDTALPISRSRVVHVGLPLETDVALALVGTQAPQSFGPPKPGRVATGRGGRLGGPAQGRVRILN